MFVLGFRVRNALLSRGSDQPLHNPPVESGRLKAHPKVALMSDRNPMKCVRASQGHKKKRANLSSLDGTVRIGYVSGTWQLKISTRGTAQAVLHLGSLCRRGARGGERL